MDDVKDKVKGFMKKVNNPFSSSSSGKFQGQGRVLGSSSSSSSSSNPIPSRQPNPPPNPKPKPIPKTTQNPDSLNNTSIHRKPPNGFDPFDSHITSGKRSLNGIDSVQCPICQHPFASEQEVSDHVESCVSNENADSEASVCGAYLSGNPGSGSVEVVLRLLGNICREPENGKFRRVRMSNAKVKEAVADVAGGVELLEFVGFELKVEDDGELWAIMEVPDEDRIGLIRRVLEMLEVKKGKVVETPPSMASRGTEEEVKERVELKKIDRQVCVCVELFV